MCSAEDSVGWQYCCSSSSQVTCIRHHLLQRCWPKRRKEDFALILVCKNYVLTDKQAVCMIDILSLFSVSHRVKVVLTPGLPQELKIRKALFVRTVEASCLVSQIKVSSSRFLRWMFWGSGDKTHSTGLSGNAFENESNLDNCHGYVLTCSQNIK